MGERAERAEAALAEAVELLQEQTDALRTYSRSRAFLAAREGKP